MRLREIHVRTQALAAMRQFYVERLGLPLVRAERGRFAVRAGASTLVFEGAPDAAPCHFAFNVPENQIDEARDWIAARAPLLPDGRGEVVEFASWSAHAVYFRDPGGHVVELIARHNLGNGSDAPFGAHALLEVSEVGVPVADVGEAVRALEDALGELPWRPAREAFAPVGDERGLLVLVREGRPWFPTEARAAARPARLHVEASRAYEGAPAALGVALRALRGGAPDKR